MDFYVRHVRCTKELWYFEGGVREVVLLSMCHIIL